ncbi:hypothetical protein [Streptococcus ovis]|uniref:hypothetical protein n=1 Tax=Streptococcus ovis TaxID=82806 RepID=UPI00035CC38B|nr:hypothetical protein [Streptococcus ovis]
MTKEKIKWYTTLLMYYLLVYGVLHLVGAITLLVFERGWGGFAYIWAFWLHVPLMLLGGIVSFLGKKFQNAYIWLLALICFVLSNAWWVYTVLYNSGSTRLVLLLGLTTIIPIVASSQLFRLTNK